MKNKKYAYCTSITRDFYIPCIILHKRIMDYLGCKYPFIVLVTNEVTEDGIKELEEYGIIVKKIQLFYLQNTDAALNYYMFTPITFSVLSLTEYDLIFNFEADIIFLENMDKYFEEVEKKLLKNFYFNAENIFYKNKIFKEPKTSFFYCKPDNNLYNLLINFNNNNNIYSDHCLMRTLFYNHFTLDQWEETNYCYPLIHFRGHPKVWRGYADYFVFIEEIFLFKNNICIEKIFNFLYNYWDIIDEVFFLQGEPSVFERELSILQEKYDDEK